MRAVTGVLGAGLWSRAVRQWRQIRPEVGAGDDHFGGRVRGIAFGVARRIGEAGWIKEGVVDLDACVEDRDLDTGTRVLHTTDRRTLPEVRGADERQAGEHGRLIMQVRIDRRDLWHGS